MRFVLINQFYPPSEAPTGRLLQNLARKLVSAGHQVKVVASGDAYNAGANNTGPHEVLDGVEVLKLGQCSGNRYGIAGKFARYWSFYAKARRMVNRLSDNTDVFLFMTTPPLIGLLGSRLRKYKNKPYILWIMDLYPHALVSAGLIKQSGFVWQAINRFFKSERANASAIISLGPDMSDLLRGESVEKVVEVPVWSDLVAGPDAVAQSLELRRARGWADDELVLMYSGNMGRAHTFSSFSDLAKLLRSTGTKARVVACGDGPQKQDWQSAHGTTADFMPIQPQTDLAAHLLSADIHLISQSTAWKGVVVPSKFQAACRLGRPVVFAGPSSSSVGRWIREYNAGWVIDPNDQLAVAKVAREISDPSSRATCSANALKLSKELFDQEKNLSAIVDLLENAGGVVP